ncbi:(2Fe-2S)-binding protein [Myceligenerans indicum]|uniref:2Fe-2S iron-sulfur cluster binding domain-containing protein n=1 Tax=Myceligenerans indicum TaxID=2593663 RepID=A0ABS1LQ29_9MICO|nr:2Fe-2S iron-sulfur cluster-binding protein [Myceligenerans indicum]MBL0888357.1 2Fe-2S iron-sulfur cluster binding domain-containing protein [Myceligenerans indicum]
MTTDTSTAAARRDTLARPVDQDPADPSGPWDETASRPTVNGTARDVREEPRRLLVDALRKDFGVTTTATSCSDGVCGTCTVLVDGDPVRSCLMLVHEADGRTVRTAEDVLASEPGLSGIFSRHHAIQCGFCTPGYLVLATAMIEAGDPVSDRTLREIVSDNICRCTGYGPIVAAFREIAQVHGLWEDAE